MASIRAFPVNGSTMPLKPRVTLVRLAMSRFTTAAR
jgi:hypothetical protein